METAPVSPRQRRARTRRRAGAGFTLIELVVTLTLVSVLALVAVPLYEMTATRARESELRTALRTVRTAIDAYKAATDKGVVAKNAGESGYPPDLKTLVDGVDTVATTMAGTTLGGAAPPPGSTASTPAAGNDVPVHMVFLRQIPRDPFFQDQSVAPEEQWNIRSYGAVPGDFVPGTDVYDISSKSTAVGVNGVAYKDW